MTAPNSQFLHDTGFALRENENILLALRPNSNTKLYFFLSRMNRAGILLLLFAVFIGLHMLIIPSYAQSWLPVTRLLGQLSLATWSVGLVAVLGLTWGYYAKLVASCVYYITDQRCIIKTGFLSQQTRVLPFNQINDINIQTSLLGKLFGLSSVCLESFGVVSANNQNRRNNATRLEGLTPAMSRQVMEVVAKQLH